MTIEYEVASVLVSLDHFEQACQSILNLEIGLSPNSIMHFLDSPNMTLGNAIDYCRDVLKSDQSSIEHGEAAENLARTFAEVAHNLEPLALRDAIKHMYVVVENLIVLERTLIRFMVSANLTQSHDCRLPDRHLA